MKAIPKEVLKVLGVTAWQTDGYNLEGYEDTLACHLIDDNREGSTCMYQYGKGSPVHSPDGRFTYADMQSLSKVIPSEMLAHSHDLFSVNQHYAHSLGQFMANCQHQWRLHVKRIEAIEGTASGRIHRR